MKLEHSFTVPTGVEEAWKILLDIERIGPCMPGAAIESVDGDDFTGSVKVKLGPIGLTYKGKASFIEKDEAARRAVIDARGRDARGNGTASAKVSATLTEQGAGSTLVKVDTDLDITGKPAQFGRGVMVDVGNKLIGQFADNLAATIGGAPAPAPARKRASRPKPTASEPAAATPAEAPAATPSTEPAGPIETAAATAAASASIDEQAVTAAAEQPSGYSAPSPEAAGAGLAASALDGAVPTSVNGRHTAASPVREVEPINLIEHAGPAVAKRLAPLVLALLILLIIWRRKRS